MKRIYKTPGYDPEKQRALLQAQKDAKKRRWIQIQRLHAIPMEVLRRHTVSKLHGRKFTLADAKEFGRDQWISQMGLG